jgi:hypothetical protein
MYGHAAWSLRLREEKRVRAIGNRMKKRTFELKTKRKAVTRDWRKLHSEDLLNFYSLPNIAGMIKTRRIRWQKMWKIRERSEICTNL